MLHLIRFILFTAFFFGLYKLYPYILASELALQLTACAALGIILVAVYALYENWEKKDNVKNNIRGRSS